MIVRSTARKPVSASHKSNTPRQFRFRKPATASKWIADVVRSGEFVDYRTLRRRVAARLRELQSCSWQTAKESATQLINSVLAKLARRRDAKTASYDTLKAAAQTYLRDLNNAARQALMAARSHSAMATGVGSHCALPQAHHVETPFVLETHEPASALAA